MARLTRVCVAVALLLPAARADVTVIDPAGGPGVELLRAALIAAAPGDVLLLAPGDYLNTLPPYVIDTGVTLLPAPGAGRLTLGPIEVVGLPAGQQLVLRGFDLLATVWLFQPTLYMHGSAGVVWLEDCDVKGFDQNTSSTTLGGFPGAAVEINQGEGVFRHCSLRGGHGIDSVDSLDGFTGSGGDALRLMFNSKATLHDCTLLGGDAGDGTPHFFSGDYGGYGAYLHASDATLAGCTLQGGAEGADNDDWPGTAGSALLCWLAPTDARITDCTFEAGALQGEGKPAPAVWDPHDGITAYDGPARGLVLPDQLREGEAGALHAAGAPGDLVLVLVSPVADLVPLKGQEGTLVTQISTLLGPIALGTLAGPDGVLDVPMAMPQLPAGVEDITVLVQGLFKDVDGSVLGGASALAWIDQAF